eukprot:12090804-Karenia_brevis.AAC.1
MQRPRKTLIQSHASKHWNGQSAYSLLACLGLFHILMDSPAFSGPALFSPSPHMAWRSSVSRRRMHRNSKPKRYNHGDVCYWLAEGRRPI